MQTDREEDPKKPLPTVNDWYIAACVPIYHNVVYAIVCTNPAYLLINIQYMQRGVKLDYI